MLLLKKKKKTSQVFKTCEVWAKIGALLYIATCFIINVEFALNNLKYKKEAFNLTRIKVIILKL